jgi:4-amino-4-deoxy-L-arabinose transferase-like glycosyltransferase
VTAYAAIIPWNAPPPDYTEESRLDLGTLQWRSSFWRELAARNQGMQLLFGRGVGTADGVFNELHEMELLPHNDYLRLFYDTGALGLLVYLNMLAFVLRLVMRSTTTENDFSLLAFLLIACFCITDNFIYFTMPMFVYVFLGSYAHRPAAAVGCALHVREGASRSYPSSAEGKA